MSVAITGAVRIRNRKPFPSRSQLMAFSYSRFGCHPFLGGISLTSLRMRLQYVGQPSAWDLEIRVKPTERAHHRSVCGQPQIQPECLA